VIDRFVHFLVKSSVCVVVHSIFL